MALRQITNAVARLSLCGGCRPQTDVSILTHLNFSSSYTCGNQFIRTFSVSSVSFRKLDARAKPRWTLPSSKNRRWVEPKMFSDMEYTVEPLPYPRTGGRGPNGRIWDYRRSGGKKRVFYMIDFVRGGPTEGPPLVEKVLEIKDDVNRSAKIALVASGDHKRYILATTSMKVGDLIKSSQVLSKTPVRAAEGDSLPLGSLPLGTGVTNIERYPGHGGAVGRSAGVTCRLVRKLDDKCIIKMPSKREIMVSSKCTAVVGRVSNEFHNKKIWGKAGAKRNAGFKPRSGLWHRKTGRFGRKIKAVKPMIHYDEPKAPKPKPILVPAPFGINIY